MIAHVYSERGQFWSTRFQATQQFRDYADASLAYTYNVAGERERLVDANAMNTAFEGIQLTTLQLFVH